MSSRFNPHKMKQAENFISRVDTKHIQFFQHKFQENIC